MKLGILGDSHLTNRAPQKRVDDYWKTLKGKVSQALKIFDDKECEIVIQVGDFFDTPTVSCRVKAEIIQLLMDWRTEKERVFCVYGQHDISGHSKSTLSNSPLAVLESAGVVKILSDNPVEFLGHEHSDILIYGASFGESVPDPYEDVYNILVIHKMVGDRPLWPGQELVGPRQFLRKHPNYNLILCLAGNTKISLLSGEEVSVSDLVGRKEFYVYSYDYDTNSIVPGRAHSCRKTKQNVPILKITLDNGEIVRCDHNERFLLRNRRYIQAKDLIIGDSLMPLYRKLNDAGYEEVLQFSDRWQKTHRMVYNWKYGRVRKKKIVAHHKDYNKLNNSPGNILAMSWNDHVWFHGQRHKEMWQNREFRERTILAMTEANRKSNVEFSGRTEELRELLDVLDEEGAWRRDLMYQKEFSKGCKKNKDCHRSHENRSLAQKKRVENGTHLFVADNPNIRRMKDGSLKEQNTRLARDPRINKIRSETMLSLAKEGKHPSQIRVEEGTHNFLVNHPMKGSAGKEKMIRTRIRRVLDILESKNLEVTKENWNNNRPHKNTPLFETALRYFEIQVNHKVVSVEFDGCEDVYSFEVDGYNNFALSAGVFVHNCGDYHYSFSDVYQGRTIINPGAIVRKTIGKFDLEHKPAVVIFDTNTNESEVIELDVESVENVFNLTPDIKKQDNTILEELVKRLRAGSQKLSGWKNTLVKVLDESKSSKAVRQVIDETLEEVKNG